MLIGSWNLMDSRDQTRALEVMLQQVQIQLQTRFTTSYAEDFADLNGPFTGYNNWVSLTARVRYKRILIRLEKELKCASPPVPLPRAAWGSIIFFGGGGGSISVFKCCITPH